MKFVSKNSNLRIILEPGLAAQPISGMPAKPTIFVKFTDGVAEVKEATLIEKMRNHPGFETDFIAVGDDGEDPFKYNREEVEPAHTITEMKYGTAVARQSSVKSPKLSPELTKMLNERAMEMVRDMLPGAVEAVLKGYAAKQVTEDADSEKTFEDAASEELSVPEPITDTNDQTVEPLEEVAEVTGDSDATLDPAAKKSVLSFLKSS